MSTDQALRELNDQNKYAAYNRAPMFLIGLDLGQAHEQTGFCVVERIAPPVVDMSHYENDEDVPAEEKASYVVRHIERFPLKAKYPAIVEGLVNFINGSEPIKLKHTLVVNITETTRAPRTE